MKRTIRAGIINYILMSISYPFYHQKYSGEALGVT